jgi:hypothetical protein
MKPERATEIEETLDGHLREAAQGNDGLLTALRAWRSQMPDELLYAAISRDSISASAQGLVVDLENVAHRQLIPHLHFSLGNRLDGHPLATKLLMSRLNNGIHNKKLCRERDEILTHIGNAGLDVLVIKGADLAFSAYPDPCCRVVGDIDLLVDEVDYDRAIKLLQDLGWANAHGDKLPPHKYVKRSLHLLHPDFIASLDVHNHATHHAIWPGTDRVHFARAVTRPGVDDCTYRGLCPEHALVQICGHGVAQNYYPPVRWAADAAWILKAAGERFDWDVMFAAMHNSRSGPILSVSLAYLHLILGVEIPFAVLHEVRRTVSGRAFRSAWRYRLTTPSGTRQRAAAFFAAFHEAAQEQDLHGMLARLPAYIRNSQQEASLLAALGSLGRKALTGANA